MGYHSLEVFKDTPRACKDVSLLFFALSTWIFQPIQPVKLLELTSQPVLNLCGIQNSWKPIFPSHCYQLDTLAEFFKGFDQFGCDSYALGNPIR